MIFVVVGTDRFPFDRLVREVDLLKYRGILKGTVYIQLGASTYRPENCAWADYLSFNDMITRIKSSDFVITHAGAGTTLLCLHLGKRPLLVTRRKAFGESVDDHQIQFAKKMVELDWADATYNVHELQRFLEHKTFKVHPLRQRQKDDLPLAKYLQQIVTNWSH